MAKKTDNHNPAAKLALRRHFLDKYHADGPIRVLDCCQGGGLLWNVLRNEYAVTSYWGLDLKPKKGRLKLDSVRVLAQAGWDQNVVDIDTYGSPWNHWLALLPNIQLPATVFLTIGQVQISGSPLQNVTRQALGIGKLAVPNAIGAKLNKLAASWLLSIGCNDRTMVSYAVESVSDGNARYIGVRLESASRSDAVTPGGPKPTRVKKEHEHV